MKPGNGGHFAAGKPPLRGACLLDKRSRRPVDEVEPLPTGGKRQSFPERPPPHTLSETIPLYFIARNKGGFWIAREAEGRIGGVFLFQRSALRFAEKINAPGGWATMFLARRLELDVANRGSGITACLNAVVGWLAKRHSRPRNRHVIFARGNE
jgi:hypothetical protein